MEWTVPPRIKVLEALGSLADGRVQVEGDTAKVFSSSGSKFYSVIFDPSSNTISCNDNGSYWQGYLGYPAIAFLMEEQLLPFDRKVASWLKGIAWKDINQQFKNDWDKTETYICDEILQGDAQKKKILLQFAESVLVAIENLKLQKPAKRVKPPSGY